MIHFAAEDNPKMFDLRLSGEGINIEQEIDQRPALRVVQVVMGGVNSVIASPSRADFKLALELADALVPFPRDVAFPEYVTHVDTIR